jgi:uncharacterized integral membrane protein (TIGR00698 family)
VNGGALFKAAVFIALGALCLTGWISPPVALAAGIGLALTAGAPFPAFTQAATRYLLQASVVGLGFGLNLAQVWAAGRIGFGFTVISIFGTLAAGWLLGRVLRVDRQASLLISTGTAICGGSAIAAVGSAIHADKRAMSVALGTVFILNAVALFLFPLIGRSLGLTQTQFGLWAAIAIHDTSSVVGSAARYGDEALRLATTVKLARALWIIPLVLGIAFLSRSKTAKVKLPWFILLFVLAAGIRTWFPRGEGGYRWITHAAGLSLTLTLFLIGTGLTRETLRTVGARGLAQGVILWLIVAVTTLLAVRMVLHA